MSLWKHKFVCEGDSLKFRQFPHSMFDKGCTPEFERSISPSVVETCCHVFCISEEIELVITQHEHLMVSVYSVRFGQSVNIPSNICL